MAFELMKSISNQNYGFEILLFFRLHDLAIFIFLCINENIPLLPGMAAFKMVCKTFDLMHNNNLNNSKGHNLFFPSSGFLVQLWMNKRQNEHNDV